MSVGVGIELDLYLSVQEAFSEEQECEHVHHNEDSAVHRGPAKWYMKARCLCCEDETSMLALCDGWKQWIYRPQSMIRCDKCEGHSAARYTVMVCEPIGKD